MGIVFVEENKKIIGAITDGDIRRALLKNINIDDLINTLINKDFVFLFEKDATKENILKLLDNRIRVIPILNNEYNFVTIVSKDNISWNEEEVLISKSRSPLRISFAGGGTDLTSYFYSEEGVVLNATINKFVHAILKKTTPVKLI